MNEVCNHAVGQAMIDYHPDILNADDDGRYVSEDSFCAFNFCPYCGKSVEDEANAVNDKINQRWAEYRAKFPKPTQ